MELREATSEDGESIGTVARASWHEAHDHIIGKSAVEELLDKWYNSEAIQQRIEREDAPMFVVTKSEVVGFIQGSHSEDGPADAAIGSIYVHPEHWGEGLGTKLLQRLFNVFRADNQESVWLSVMANNDVGRSFYDKHGFDMYESRTTELAGEEVDDMILVRDL